MWEGAVELGAGGFDCLLALVGTRGVHGGVGVGGGGGGGVVLGGDGVAVLGGGG